MAVEQLSNTGFEISENPTPQEAMTFMAQHPELAAATFLNFDEIQAYLDGISESEKLEQVYALKTEREQLIADITGLSGEALNDLLHDQPATFMAVSEKLGQLYAGRSIQRNHGNSVGEHFATRNAERTATDLNFTLTKDRQDSRLTFASLTSDLQHRLPYEVTINASASGKFSVTRPHYERGEHHSVGLQSEEEALAVLGIFYEDVRYAVEQHEVSNDAEALKFTIQRLNKRT